MGSPIGKIIYSSIVLNWPRGHQVCSTSYSSSVTNSAGWVCMTVPDPFWVCMSIPDPSWVCLSVSDLHVGFKPLLFETDIETQKGFETDILTQKGSLEGSSLEGSSLDRRGQFRKRNFRRRRHPRRRMSQRKYPRRRQLLEQPNFRDPPDLFTRCPF